MADQADGASRKVRWARAAATPVSRPLRIARPTSSRPAGRDYLTVEHAEIYVAWSRHWAAAWVCFLS